MASLDDLLRQLGIGGVTRNRAGQIVTNTNDVVPVATAGLADTLYGAGRGTLAGTAAIGGIPGDINQMYVNKFGALFPIQPAPPTSEQISTAVKRAVPSLNLSRDNTGSVATSLGENVIAPITAPESLLGAARATKGLPVGMSIKEVKQSGLLSDLFNVTKRDASDTFGAGTERIRYVDPKSGGTIEVLSKPDNTASVISLEVPEQFRGKKIGESLQARALQDFPELQGQVSSKAAAKTAYRLGRRPAGEPNATLDDVFKAIEDNSSVNLISPEMQKRFIGDVETLYHGTTPQAAKAIEKAGFDINKSADGTIWFTSNPNIGEVSATGSGAVIKRMLDKSKMKLGGWDETDKYSTDQLINMGYDGLALKDKGVTTYQIFNPEKLKK